MMSSENNSIDAERILREFCSVRDRVLPIWEYNNLLSESHQLLPIHVCKSDYKTPFLLSDPHLCSPTIGVIGIVE
jgi:hypothetical protein